MTTSNQDTEMSSRHVRKWVTVPPSFLRTKNDAHPTDIRTLDGLPDKVLSQICENLRSEHLHSWRMLLQTSRHLNRIASTLQYRTSHVFGRLDEPVNTSSSCFWPYISLLHDWQGPSLKVALANDDEATLNQVKVLHTYSHPNMVGKGKSDKPVSLPNLQVLHFYALPSNEPLRDTFPTVQQAPNLHTVVLHSCNALTAWQNYWQSEAAANKTKRMIIDWWGGRHCFSRNDPQLHLSNSESVQALHIVLTPWENEQEWCPMIDTSSHWLASEPNDEALNQVEEEQSLHVNFLVDSLAQMCASEAKSIIIAGLERISPYLWLGTRREAGIPSSSEQTSLIQGWIKSRTAEILSNSGASKAKIASQCDRVKFQDLVDYAENAKNSDELGGRLLEHLTSLREYHRPAIPWSEM